MYKELSGLVLYRDLGEDSILYKVAEIFHDKDLGVCDNATLITRIYQQIKRILDLATSYGFNKNLWQDSSSFRMCLLIIR